MCCINIQLECFFPCAVEPIKSPKIGERLLQLGRWVTPPLSLYRTPVQLSGSSMSRGNEQLQLQFNEAARLQGCSAFVCGFVCNMPDKEGVLKNRRYKKQAQT